MAIKIGSNFTFQGQQPNFERDRFATKAAMKAFPETSIDDGHLSYCAEDGNTYQFKSSNSVDNVTGKWRVFKKDVDLSAYATKNDVAIDLANKVNIKGEGIRTPSRDTIVKIAVFNFGYIRYKTSYAYLTIMCRNVVTKVVIAINNDDLPGKLTVFENRVLAKIAHYSTQENVYYYHETDTGKVTLYYSTVGDDEIRVKLTDKGVNYDFDYNPTMEIVDALPEGAIKVHNVNYGNKNLFYATPKDVAGDPTFRAIDITDLPDLSSKYATKAEITTINDNIADVRTSLESTQTDFVDLRNKVNAMPKTVFITQAAYNALTTKDANTIYYING